MPTRRSAFTQLDVQRAARGARAAGVELDEIIITTAGEIRMRARRQEASSDTPQDVRDEIARHFADGPS